MKRVLYYKILNIFSFCLFTFINFLLEWENNYLSENEKNMSN